MENSQFSQKCDDAADGNASNQAEQGFLPR